MNEPHYQGRRIAGRPRLFYVHEGQEEDITHVLEVSNITFISDLEWRGNPRQLVELARTLIWHATRSHALTHMWGPSLSWDMLGWLDDGWVIPVDRVLKWIARMEANARQGRRTVDDSDA